MASASEPGEGVRRPRLDPHPLGCWRILATSPAIGRGGRTSNLTRRALQRVVALDPGLLGLGDAARDIGKARLQLDHPARAVAGVGRGIGEAALEFGAFGRQLGDARFERPDLLLQGRECGPRRGTLAARLLRLGPAGARTSSPLSFGRRSSAAAPRRSASR